MQLFSVMPERQMRLVRWGLLIGWLLLITSLLLPVVSLPAWLAPACSAAHRLECERHLQPGNRLFWGTVVPVGILMIGVFSHELWRRACPLAFVSQLGRSLGWQRTRPGRRGRPEVVLVGPESWLGRHHLALQWSLLTAGLCLRLLVVNGHPLGLAILLLGTLAAALLVGWAWGGKAWCQYICPMGPVQTVLTGLRGPLGSTAHVGTSTRITQSMCRTIAADGREQSACVACSASCIDIDAERTFWQTLRGRRSLAWAWYAYPGLTLMFFLLMDRVGVGTDLAPQPLGYLRSGSWAFDAGLPGRIWQPLWPAVPLPRLLMVPLLLSAASLLSLLLFRGLEIVLERQHRHRGLQEARARAVLHTRLLASFLAINIFFWFVDPFQGGLGPNGGQLMRSLVLMVSAIGLFRSWVRDEATYRRESASESLRRQLRDLPGLEAALDGRSLEALSPQEVFTLVKAFPAMGRQQGRTIYRDVMAEMLRTGRLDRARSLLELQELRQTLHLEDADHHAVVRQLTREQPELLEAGHLQRQVDDLRGEAAREAIEELLQLAGQEVMDTRRWPADLQARLQRFRVDSGLDDAAWTALLEQYGPQGARERQRLDRLRSGWIEEAGLAALLETLQRQDSLLRPLWHALRLRLRDARSLLVERLAAAGMPPLPAVVEPAGRLEQAFDLLWHDADPDTAAWVLMLERQRTPERVGARLRDPRAGLGDSPFLQHQRRGIQNRDLHELETLTRCGLFADLLPTGLIWVAGQGSLLELDPGVTVMRIGEPSDSLSLVVSGTVQVETAKGRRVELGIGQSVGEVGLIRGTPRLATVVTGEAGACLFVLTAEVFEEMLQRSSGFGRLLLGQLAERLMVAARTDG
ncbi:MAG: cyclic nucleotide-binding domain-containing protein [Cyanobium sp.]